MRPTKKCEKMTSVCNDIIIQNASHWEGWMTSFYVVESTGTNNVRKLILFSYRIVDELINERHAAVKKGCFYQLTQNHTPRHTNTHTHCLDRFSLMITECIYMKPTQ